VNCLNCGGVAWTIGRYGAERIDGYFFTRLTSASQDELTLITQALTELSAKQNPTVEEVASTLARLGEIGLAISQWIEANGGWFGAGSFLIALIMLIIGSGSGGGGGGNQIHIDQVIIGDTPTPFVAPSTSPNTPLTPSSPESPELPPGPSGR
jgi:hypothetical protein